MKRNSSFNRKIVVSIVTMLAVLTLMLEGCKNGNISNQNTLSENDNNQPESEEQLKDGEYNLYVSLSGGSGKTSLKSPTTASVCEGYITALVEWSSPNYDYMIINGEKYLPVNETGNSVFEIPLNSLNESISVVADTVAMSKPHEIEYVITFSENNNIEPKEIDGDNDNLAINTLSKEEKEEIENWYSNHTVSNKLELKYAQNYHVLYFDDKYCVIEINGNDYYLLVEKGDEIPSDLPKGFIILEKPIENIYVVSSASLDYFSCLNALDNVAFTSLKKEDVKDTNISTLMEDGKINYAGKYSAPDYELLLSKGCSLAVENTMIGHSPDVLEQLHKVKINTLIDYSSRESTPYGRMEWIKLYGILTGKEELSSEIFSEKENSLSNAFSDTEKTVAYFYITNSGGVVIRKNQDYIAELIDIAGGNYIFKGDSTYDGTGTMTIQKEAFFEAIKDCDYLIYNSTIAGELKDKNELLAKCEVLKNTKAFSNGNIYSTTDNIYLSVMELPDIAKDINDALMGKDTSRFLYRLE